MKKSIVIAIQLMSLSAILAVSTFAWFKVTFNAGQNTITIPTDDTGSEFVFAKNQMIEEALAPAKLKKGVLSDVTNGVATIDGHDTLTGKYLLPGIKTNDQGYTEYCVEEGRMKFQTNPDPNKDLNTYFDYPSTLIYSQYRFMASGPNMRFTFGVYYPKLDVALNEDGEVIGNDGNPVVINKDNISTYYNRLEQIEALNFNFFVTPYDNTYTLNDEELQKASTSIGTANAGKITIENTLSNKVKESGKNMILCGKGATPIDINGASASAKEEQVKSGRIESTKNEVDKTYKIELTNLPITQFAGYNLIVESYYALPDMLVEGNLPLSCKFLLLFNVEKFTPTTSS